MEYPKNIILDKETEERLISYLREELFNHEGERSGFLDDLAHYQQSYWADPGFEEFTFPFQNASKIIVPLNAIAVEAIHARTMTTMFGLSQFISAKATNPDWTDAATPFERFFDHELLHNLKVYKVLDNIILELEKYGTGVGKAGYEKIIKYAIRDVGGVEEEFPVIIKDGASLDPVPLGRVLMPYTANDMQDAPWCGEEHSETPYVFKQLVESGLLYEDAFEKVESWVNTLSTASGQNENKQEDTQASLENRVAVWPDRLGWVELWMAFNVDGNDDGKEREIVVHFHKDSNQLLSIRNNWHTDLRRPYRKGIYFPVEHRWAGLGICKQNDQFQDEVTTRTRQQMDNATLANVRMIKVSRLSGIGPGEPIFPGKIWSVDDMTHVDTFQLGEIYPSAYNTIQQAITFSQMRSGVNEVTLGQPAVGTPGTASDALSRVQEGNKKQGYIFKNIKDFVNELVIDVACNIHQFGSRSIEFLDNLPNGDLVKELFKLPESYIRDGLLIEITTAGQQENKLLDRQNWLQVSQIFQSYVMSRLQLEMQIMQMAPGSNQKELMDIITVARTGGTEIMRQILESFDTRNIDRIIGSNIKNATQQGGNGQAQNPGQAGGMGSLPQLLAPTQGGGIAPASSMQIGS